MPGTKSQDVVTQMAKQAQNLEDAFGKALNEVPGAKRLTTDQLADVYLMATFEQRLTMFQEVLATDGQEGLKSLKEIYVKAVQKHQAEGGGV